MRIINRVLEPREKQIIFMRFGINGKKPMTQKRVAEVLGISRSYVSRIEKNALAKIKNAFS
jgi:RNA polymerase sporulation-specific sigma factor